MGNYLTNLLTLGKDAYKFLFRPSVYQIMENGNTKRVFARSYPWAQTMKNVLARVPESNVVSAIPRMSILESLPRISTFAPQIQGFTGFPLLIAGYLPKLLSGNPIMQLSAPETISLLEYTPLPQPTRFGSVVTYPSTGSVIALPLWLASLLVDNDGNINWAKWQDVLQKLGEDFKKPASSIRNSSGGLDEHLKSVAETALTMPVPTGSTKQELVLSALLHDIGKFKTSSGKTHGLVGAGIVDDYVLGVPQSVKTAIDLHMRYDHRYADPLTRALVFADVARGKPYDTAAYLLPYLMYPTERLMPAIADLLRRDLIKYILNPMLIRYGYPTIDLNASPEEQQKQLDAIIARHKTFIRGVSEPNVRTQLGIRNMRNANIGVRTDYLTEPNKQLRLLHMAEFIPVEPSGGLRQGLFDVHTYYRPESMHLPNAYTRMLGVNPSKDDALYFSGSRSIGKEHTEGTGESFKVKLNTPVPSKELSLPQLWLLADFPFFNTAALHGHSAMSSYYMFEQPYRFLTGRSLQQDIIDLDPNVPKLEYEKQQRDYLYPLYAFEYNRVQPTKYEIVRKSGDNISKLMTDLTGSSKEIAVGQNGEIFVPDSVRELENILRQIKKVKDFFDFPDYSSKDGLLDGFYANSDEYTRKQANYETAIKILLDKGILSEKQTQLLNKMPLSRKRAFLKKNNLIKKAWNNYFDALKKDKTGYGRIIPTRKSIALRSRYVSNPQVLMEFMRSKGVLPRYEWADWLDQPLVSGPTAETKPKTKSKKIKSIYGKVVGKKGEKMFTDATPITDEDEISRKTFKIGGKL